MKGSKRTEISGRTKFISDSFGRSILPTILFTKSTRRNFDGESPRAKMRTHFLEGGICRHLPTLQLARPIYKARPRGIARSPLPPTYHGRPACKSTLLCAVHASSPLLPNFRTYHENGSELFSRETALKATKGCRWRYFVRQTVPRHA